MLPRSHRLFRTRGGRVRFRSRAVLPKNPGNFWEMVSPKPAIFRDFSGFWVGAFPGKFREFLGFSSLRVFEISGKFRDCQRNFLEFWGFWSAVVFLIKIPGIFGFRRVWCRVAWISGHVCCRFAAKAAKWETRVDTAASQLVPARHGSKLQPSADTALPTH